MWFDDDWLLMMIYDDPACQMTEVWERSMYLCEHASECLKRSPHTSFMFSSLNNKQQKNPILYIYTSGTIPLPFTFQNI